MKTLKIYKITNKINGKVYVGQTSESLSQRFSRHMGYQSKEHDSKFYRAIRKYGKDNFFIELLDTAETQEELDEKEVFWILKLNAVSNGYNSNAHKGRIGGDTLSNHPNIDNIKKKIALSKKGSKNPNAKAIKAIDILNNKTYVFQSMAECVEKLGFSSHACISRRCLHKIKSPYKGRWLFEYFN